MKQIFGDEAKEKEASITDLILLVLQLLREDIQGVIDFIKLVELWDEGQPNYIVNLVYGNIET